MDIEIFIGIEKILNKYLFRELIKIIYNYLDLSFDKIIDNHILAENKLIKLISFELREEFDLEYNIEFEIFNIIDHLEYIYHPEFIELNYNYSPFIDFQFSIKYNNFLWEIKGDIEPGYYLYGDCY